LHVAVTVEGAGRGVVAQDPVLVGTRLSGHHERVRPGQCSVRGAVHHHARSVRARHGKRSDEPNSVRRVVGNGRVTHAIEAAARVDGGSGEEPVGPRPPSIGRRSPADIGGTSVEEATALEGRDDRRSVRESVRLDLRFVLGTRVGEGVGADLCRVRRRLRRGRRDQPRNCQRGRYCARLPRGSPDSAAG